MQFFLGREVVSTDRFSNTLILLSCIFLLKMKSFHVENLSLVTSDLVSNSRLANGQSPPVLDNLSSLLVARGPDLLD